MLNKMNIDSREKLLIVCIILSIVTLAVFFQVRQYDFVKFDDPVYVTDNEHIKSGTVVEKIQWAFGTKYLGLWNPLVWLSLMLDYQLFRLKAGGYHMTNLILHMLSALFLFGLFYRMTGAIWRSAFVAALFAVHPLHVESVAWIAERKDVLSALGWMLTLYMYVYYVEKPVIKRYLLVLFFFVLALMSKPMVVTLPVIMILLDYWPLKRFEYHRNNLILWQLKEKLPFFVLSAILVIMTLNGPDYMAVSSKVFPLHLRLANAPVAFVTYLLKTFWPYDLAVFYPFSEHIPLWQVMGSTILIFLVSSVVIATVKHSPYLFVGWFWYAITITPVIGILQISSVTPYSMADRYHYLTSVGIAVGIIWGFTSLFRNKKMRRNILFPLATIFLMIIAVLAWRQCSYWKNNIELFSHNLEVTKDNYLAHNFLASSLTEAKRTDEAIYHCKEAIRINPSHADAYFNRGNIYYVTGQYQSAMEDYNKTITLDPYYLNAYNNRGIVRRLLGQYKNSLEDFNEAIRLKPDYAEAYNNRSNVYFVQGYNELGCDDARKACALGICRTLEAAKVKGNCR